MRLVRLGEAQPGVRLGRSVVTEDGRVLLPSGVELTEAYIRSLATYAVDAVYVVEVVEPTAAALEVVSRASRRDLGHEMKQAMREISSSFSQASRGIKFPSVAFQTAGLKRTVDRVVNEVLANPRALVTLQDIRQWDQYTLLHSIEVCILSTMVGSALGLSRAELGELAMSALLHDIGKTGIPLEILNKPGPLNPAEMSVMNRHTSLGWALLRTQRELSEAPGIVALQHHERWNGKSGYPLGLTGEKIHPYARICAVADVYDAMTADRVYRRGLSPAEALEAITGPLREGFDPGVLAAFLQCVAPFPVGLLVELSDGRTGEVVAVDHSRLDRPRVRVTGSSLGATPVEPHEIDLVAEASLSIVRRMPDLNGLLEDVAT
ncbi:MAG: HD-GYP domain-containing protein [Bacillota bacterium]